MTFNDWHGASSDALGEHYGRQRTLWEHDLGWDTRDAWREVEAARRARRLPGVVLSNGRGGVRGFAYCFLDGTLAQLGPLVTDTPGEVQPLLAAVLERAQREGAAAASYFGLHTGRHLERALVEAGFDVRPYVYFTRDSETAPPSTRHPNAAAWSLGDVAGAARLLQAAYGSGGRLFAPDGHVDQWERYVGNLVGYMGCGTFDTDSTCVLRESGRLMALALVTTIGPGVSHLAQLAVHPDAAGRGVGGGLLDEALARAFVAGRRRMTLLAEASSPVTRLYASRGFTRQAEFLAGSVKFLTSEF